VIKRVKGFKDTIAWYDANAEGYATSLEKCPRLDWMDRFARMAGEGARVLDAGCAGGRDCRLFKDMNLNPIGVDLSESLIRVAKAKNPGIEFKCADFSDLPFRDNSFDGVWAHASLVHLETIEKVRKAFGEFGRVLKKEGIVHIAVKQQLGKDKTAVVSDALSGHDRFFRYFTKNEIQYLLQEAGFKLLTIDGNLKDSTGRKEVRWIVALAKKVISGPKV
jgi:ubiquinone/menaquinone biosynthesis C-methylase UbiE